MHPNIEKAYELLADRDDQEREHAAWLDQRAVELENQECDEMIARLASRRQQTSSSNSGELVYKDFSGCQRQAPRLELEDVFHPLQLKVLTAALRIERGRVKQRQTDAISALRARFDEIEAALAALDARLSELENSDGGGNGGYQG
jgi:hypothetical protein